eukprot:CAMPEP_0113852146 /NCGR_PEP_ID=MMETSP0372-20130328/5256_1 /TAXON_ID=340204 /ORGANISM="Lankesteria abbotti" /LENGTH=124 /DNA_ID=CAMNT_0000823479 /DNA_START=52 /DNA_END=423 /DNA_ORIENTATION=+ /assembly_acc=CAM_ASM_000359
MGDEDDYGNDCFDELKFRGDDDCGNDVEACDENTVADRKSNLSEDDEDDDLETNLHKSDNSEIGDDSYVNNDEESVSRHSTAMLHELTFDVLRNMRRKATSEAHNSTVLTANDMRRRKVKRLEP